MIKDTLIQVFVMLVREVKINPADCEILKLINL